MMRHRMPGMMVGLMIAALAGTEPVESQTARRARYLNRQRIEARLLGVPGDEVDALVADLDAKAAALADNSVADWFWAFDEVCRSWRDARIAAGVKAAAERFSRVLPATESAVESMVDAGMDLSGRPKPIVEAMGASTQADAPPRGIDKGRTMAEVNRERRARGELGTKRERRVRRQAGRRP